MTDYIVSNQIRCLFCGDEPYSTTRHNYKTCKCGKVAVDGGQAYLRRAFVADMAPDECYKDISIVISQKAINMIVDELEKTAQRGVNTYGLACAALRALRDSGEKITFGEEDDERTHH